MKRTPPWVFIAAVGLQLAALSLCVWAMELWRRTEPAEDAPAPEPPPRPHPQDDRAAGRDPFPAPAPPRPAAPAPSTPPPASSSPSRVTVAGHPVDRSSYQMPPAAREVIRPVPPPEPSDAHLAYSATPARPGQPAEPFERVAAEPARPVAYAAEPPPRPLFGPPPERAGYDFGTNGFAEPAIPRFITEVADDTTQLVTGTIRERAVTFGFYPDGNIRFVDVDGGRYGGKAESARARMREVDGLRAFTVQIGVALDGRLQATFTGGLHDAATYPLEPLVGWGA